MKHAADQPSQKTHLNDSFISPFHFQECREADSAYPISWCFGKSDQLCFTSLKSQAAKIIQLLNTKPGVSYLNNLPLTSLSIHPPCCALAFSDTAEADGANALTCTCCLLAGKESDTIAETLDTALQSQDAWAENSNIWMLTCEGFDALMVFRVSFLSYFSDALHLFSPYTLSPIEC